MSRPDRWTLLGLTHEEDSRAFPDLAIRALAGEGPGDPVLGVLDAVASDLSTLALIMTRAEEHGAAEDTPIGDMLAALGRRVDLAVTMLRQADEAMAKEGGAA